MASKHELALPGRDNLKHRKKAFRKEIEEGTDASKLQMEERRNNLQLYVAEMDANIAVLGDPNVPAEKKSAFAAKATLGALAGMLDGMTYLADCMSSRQKRTFKNKITGKKTKRTVRYTTDMAAGNVEDFTGDTMYLTQVIALMIRDFIMMQLDPEYRNKWRDRDEENLWRCPYDLKERVVEEEDESDAEEEPLSPEETERLEKAKKNIKTLFGNAAEELAKKG